MKKRDLIVSGLLLMNVSVFAGTPGVDEPIRYNDDAKQIFLQDFEKASKNFTEKHLNPDENAYDLSLENKNKRPTTLYTWDANPVDKIEKVTYYKRQSSDDKRTDTVIDLSSSSIGSGTNIYDGSSQWMVAGVRDTLMELFDGVVKTDAKWPEDSILNYDQFYIMDHTNASQHGHDIGGKEYGMDRFGEDGGKQYFQYISRNGNGIGSYSSDNKAVPEYRRNLFIRNIPIEANSSYRVTVFVKPTQLAKGDTDGKKATPRIGLDLMRGYFHSEKPFIVNNKGHEGKNQWGQTTTIYDQFNDKTDYTDLEEGKWNKITLMSYYCNDEVGNASPYILGYYWLNDWTWQTKANKADSTVNANGDTTMIFRAVQQPAKYFVRLSFRADSIQYDVDNLSLTKSWIGGVEHYDDMLRVDFGYKTNMGDLAQAALEKNKIAAVELPGEYFDVWALWEGNWWQIPIRSAEYQGDGYMYMWTEDDEDGNMVSFDGADSVLVSFRNPKDRDDLKLLYTGDQYPNGLDEEWQNDKAKRLVFDFHNEISALNPTITVSPKTKKAVRSLKDLPPVLQEQPYEDGTFGLDGSMTEMTFKFSRNLAFDGKGKNSKITKVVLRKGGTEEYWSVKPYGDITDGTTTIVRPAGLAALSGDYVLSFEQVTHLADADPSQSSQYGEVYNFNLHFGEFSENPSVITYFQTDWNVDANATEAVCLGTAIIDGSNTSYTLGEGKKGSGSRLYRYSDAGQMDCAYYLCPRGTSTDARLYIGVGDEEYKIQLAAGTYKLSFFALGWDGKAETKVYIYPKPAEVTTTPNQIAVENKTLLGTFTPTNQIANSDGKKTNYVISTADEKNIEFTLAEAGTYIIEFFMDKSANWAGTLYSDVAITNVGVLSDGPVTSVNNAIASAAKMLQSADAAKYRGTDYNNLVSVKNVADGFIAAKKAAKVNLPSEYAAEAKTINDAVGALKVHMDTVDLFDKKVAEVVAKIALFEDSLKVYATLPEVADLNALNTSYSSYDYKTKKPGEIKADIDVLDNGIKAVDNRIALNGTLAAAKAYAKLYADSALKVKGAESAEYKSVAAAIAHTEAFDSVSCTAAQLKAEMMALTDAAFLSLNKEAVAAVSTKRIDSLSTLAAKYGADLASVVPADKLAEIVARIQNIDCDDDELAEILKSAIKVAIYDKIVKGEDVDGIDLTPFIKNYYFYTIVKGVVDNSSLELPNSRNDAKAKGYNNAVAQIQKIGHQWGQSALDKKIWVLLLDTEYDDLFPGWTVKSEATSGHSMFTPDNGSYENLSKGVNVFDGQITTDWNSKVILKQTVEGLPAGIYTLNVGVTANAGTSTLTATTDMGEFKKTLSGKDAKNENISVREGKMDINFEFVSGSGSNGADNFSLTFSQDKDQWFAPFYQVLLNNAKSELDNKVTVVDAAVAEGASVEYITLGGIKVDAPVEGQIILRKTTENGSVVVNKVLSK